MAENLIYRGHPLRRVDNLVYYGSMADKYIIMMQVLDTEDVKDLKLAKRVSSSSSSPTPTSARATAWSAPRRRAAWPRPWSLPPSGSSAP